MKKNGWKEKLQYQFDNLMSKGTVALVAMLFLITLIVVVITGTLSILTDNGMGIGTNLWMSLQHAIDAGTLAGDDTANVGYVILMSVVTVCGIFITSILIGIITTGFEDKLAELRKGRSCVLETDHTVILGFNEQIYTLLTELITANENRKKPAIVVIGTDEKEEMEHKIAEQIPNWKNTRIICRTGAITEPRSFQMASLDTCRSVIINETNDFLVIKSILAAVNYLKSAGAFENSMHITAMIDDKLNYEAAMIAGEGKLELIHTQDAISRIVAHTCRQPGLSNVLIELFDYDGDELYFEQFPELAGKSFGEALSLFEKAVPFGVVRKGQPMVNPAKSLILEKEDQMILLEDDDGVAKPQQSPVRYRKEWLCLSETETAAAQAETLLVLGSNRELPGILMELDHYAVPGSRVLLAVTEEPELELSSDLQNLKLETRICSLNDRRSLDQLVTKEINRVLILSDLDCDADLSDAQTLLKLIHLRDISQKRNQHLNITSEMQLVENQRLAEVTKVNDFVVGTNIINLILTQISENRELTAVFTDLLDEDGSEIYMKKASRYVILHEPVDFYTVTAAAAAREEIAVGYKLVLPDGSFQIVTNPGKGDTVSFGEDDYLIVLAEE